MKVIHDVESIFDIVRSAQRNGKTVGVVPTMGALHEGHLSLVRAARDECDIVVATIFVNPTQFAPNEDLDQYPRPLEQDLEKLANLQVDAVFCPANQVVYPPGFSTYVEPPEVAGVLEGKARSTHFRGVATVVLKLFHMIPADKAYFGQKDYQQTLVIRKMVEDFNMPVEIIVCPIVRESDGLAMSSRNTYLSAADRERATALYQGLEQIRTQIQSGYNEASENEKTNHQPLSAGDASIGDLTRVVESAIQKTSQTMEGQVDELEYLVAVDADSLQPIHAQTRRLAILVAARVGSTRLIDNLLIDLPDIGSNDTAC